MAVDACKFTLYAPAKINLFLHVLGKRSDGYHDLETWMQKLRLFDIITLELIPTHRHIEFFCTDPNVPGDHTNLAVRAANAFLAASQKAGGYGLRMHLEKQIPVAAGLGGGSSDAGTVLQGLNTIFGEEFGETQLITMARSLGADVPFFAVSHDAVIAEGIGDIMYPVASRDDCTFILVNPGIFISTAWAFQNLTLTESSKNSKLSCFQKPETVAWPWSEISNDLERVTCGKYPEIERIRVSLLAAGAVKALMSGSGSTVFGVFPDAGVPASFDFDRIVGGLRQEYGERVYLLRACTGASPSGKAPGFDPGIRRFESFRPSHH
jgi:4-diphosphocytidyl-2-C-methyl-D-erythritol kinase